MKKPDKKIILDYAKIVLSAILMAASVSLFFDPFGLVQGGVNGISIITKYLVGKAGLELSLSVLTIVYNLPLLIIGWIILGREFIFKTLVNTLLTSVFLYLFELIPPLEIDLFLAMVIGAVLSGFGCGLAISAGGTTGGSDLLAYILQKTRFKHLPVMNVLMVIDGLIVVAGAFVFGLKNAMYALVSIYITTQCGNLVTVGVRVSQGVYIISEKWKEIADKILAMDRGVTGIKSVGMYTGQEKNMLYCVVSTRELPKIKEIAYQSDEKAFVIVSEVKEVLGEGFFPYES